MNTRTERPTFSRDEWSELNFILPPFLFVGSEQNGRDKLQKWKQDEVELRSLISAKCWPLCPSIHSSE